MNDQANLPEHFFVLGAAKCGTTSLYSYLAQHPSIVMAEPKEPIFFEGEYERGLDYYRTSYFPHRDGEPYAGEARHRNLYLPYVAPRLHESFPDAKLIVILRNPVERAYSHYLHRKRHYGETHSFEDAIKADRVRIDEDRTRSPSEIERCYRAHLSSNGVNSLYTTILDTGYYAQQIERYLEFFPRERLLVLLFDDLCQDPAEVFARLLAHINPGLSPAKVDFSNRNRRPGKLRAFVNRLRRNHPGLRNLIRTVTPQSARRGVMSAVEKIDIKNPTSESDMRDGTRDWLVEHYREHNARLERLIGLDLSVWDKPAPQEGP